MPEYLTDLDKVKLYGERVRRADRAFDSKWRSQARSRIERYQNKPRLEQYTQQGNRVNAPAGIAIIDSLYSSLTAVDVDITATARGNGDPAVARTLEQAMQYVWRDAKVMKQGRYAIKDALLAGIGWVKVGYDYADHIEIHEKTVEEMDAEVKAIYEEAKAVARSPKDLPDPDIIAASIAQEQEVQIIDRDRIVVDHVPWDQIVWDPTAEKFEDVRWIAQITLMPVEEVQENATWAEYVKEHSGKGLKPLNDLKPDTRIGRERWGIGKDDNYPENEDDSRVTVVEYHNLTMGTICTFPLNSNFMLNEQAMPTIFDPDLEDRSLFVPLVLRDDPENVRGISDMELLEPSLDELNRLRSALLNYIERHVAKVAGKKGVLTEVGKESLMSPDPEFVELSDQATGPQDIQPLTPPTLPQEAFALEMRAEQQLRDATGVSEVMRGLFPDRKRTATETTEVVAASSVRQSEKRSLLEEFFTGIGIRTLKLIQAYWDEDRVVKVAELDGDAEFKFSADDIVGQWNIEVALAPKQYNGPVEREERAMKVVNFIGALPEGIKHRELAVWALREMGLSMTELREFIEMPEEKQAREQQEIARNATEAEATAEAQALGTASGDPSVPGGATGTPDIPGQPPAVDAAAMLGAEENAGPLDYVAGV